jgi:hypothetical protein
MAFVLGACLADDLLAGEAILSPRQDSPTIYARDYSRSDGKIHYEDCKEAKKGEVSDREYVVFDSENACVNVAASDQIKFIENLFSGLIQKDQVKLVIVYSNPKTGLSPKQIENLKKRFAGLQVFGADRFYVQIGWAFKESEFHDFSKKIRPPLRKAVGPSFDAYVQNIDISGKPIVFGDYGGKPQPAMVKDR